MLLPVSAVLAVGAGLAIVALRPPPTQAPLFNGIELDPRRAATDFALPDQHGHLYRLGEARGRVVLLTFLYTSCTDVCPYLAVKLRQVQTLLGVAPFDVVAVSTDPDQDTAQRVHAYTAQLGAGDHFHFLVGAREELEPIWQVYLVGATAVDELEGKSSPADTVDSAFVRDWTADVAAIAGAGLDQAALAEAEALIDEFGDHVEIMHSAPLWLIDRVGQLRLYHPQEATPEQLAEDVRALLQERPMVGAAAW